MSKLSCNIEHKHYKTNMHDKTCVNSHTWVNTVSTGASYEGLLPAAAHLTDREEA